MQVRRHQQQPQTRWSPGRADGCPRIVEKTSCRRYAGHEADDAGRGGAQPDPGSMVDDSMPKLRWEAEALGADAVALVQTESSTSRQRAGAFGLSAGVAMDLRLGWDLGQRADQVKAEKRLRLILSPMCLSLSRLQHAKPDELAELREQGKRLLEFACSLARLQIERRGTRSLRVSLGGVGGAVLVEAEVDRWHALCSMRSVPIWNDFG